MLYRNRSKEEGQLVILAIGLAADSGATPRSMAPVLECFKEVLNGQLRDEASREVSEKQVHGALLQG